MFRNVCYDAKDECIHLFTWNDIGDRVWEKYPFKPYLYVAKPDGKDGISIYGEALKRIEFQNKKSREQFIQRFPKCYYNLKPEQQFLIDKFKGMNKNESFQQNPLKIFYLDIEVYSPDGFPNPHKAESPINLITVYDSLSGIYHTFGTKQYYGNQNFSVYHFFEDEFEMLRAFVRFWRKDFPDVVSGWNVLGFDIPYIINRINKLYAENGVYQGQNAANRLSPLEYCFCMENVERRVESYEFLWEIRGITILDYMYLYKVFTRDKRESYALGKIAEEELGVSKSLANTVNLSQMADQKWDEFVDYNIHDVRLVVQLESKLRYIEICKRISYLALSNLKTAESTVAVVTGIIAQKALESGRIISTFEDKQVRDFDGGYVKVPQSGLQRSILYFDANSLYPNTIVTLNISPETKIGTIREDGDGVVLHTKTGKEIQTTKDKIQELMKTENLALSKSGTLFSQKKKGLVPDIIEEIYADRVATRRNAKKLEQEKRELAAKMNSGSDAEKQNATIRMRQINLSIDQADIYQYTLKILLNRIYGYFAEKSSPFYDIDLASSVTLTGQGCIKEASRVISEYVTKEYGLPENDYIIANDTDSAMITIDPIIKKLNMPIEVEGAINPEVYNIAVKFKIIIDESINNWAINELGSKWPKYEFKLENISTAGIFIKKKHYILEMICDEDGHSFTDKNGKRIPRKYKYTGVEVVKTSTPKKVKPFIKKVVELILTLGDKAKVSSELESIYQQYCELSIEDIAIPTSLNNYDKYEGRSTGMKIGKGTPMHVKSAITYNRLLEKHKLTGKYETLKSGDKIKFMLVEPNSHGITTIAFLNEFPVELSSHIKVDKKAMFEKSVLKPLDRIFNALGWSIKPPTAEEVNDLLAMFS